MAEALRLLGQDDKQHMKGAVEHYLESFELSKDASSLYNASVCSVKCGQAKKLIKYSECLATDLCLFTCLLELFAKSKEANTQLVNFFFMTGQHSGLVVSALKTFSKELAPKLVSRLLGKCSEPVMKELSKHLLQDEEKQVAVLKETKGQSLRLQILKLVEPSSTLLKKIREKDRTLYVKDMIEHREFDKAYIAVESGELDQSRINIPHLMSSLLEGDNETLLRKLLERGNSKIMNSVSSLSQMCSPQAKTKFKIKCRAVAYMHCLLVMEPGADVEEMNAYSRGSRTSPLHVATHLALETGNTEFLRNVYERRCPSWNPDDKDGKTPFQIAETSTLRFQKEAFDFFTTKENPPATTEELSDNKATTINAPPVNTEGVPDNIPMAINAPPVNTEEVPDNIPMAVNAPPVNTEGVPDHIPMAINDRMKKEESSATAVTIDVTDPLPKLNSAGTGNVYSTLPKHSAKILQAGSLPMANPVTMATSDSDTTLESKDTSSAINEQELHKITKPDLIKRVRKLLEKSDDYFISPEEQTYSSAHGKEITRMDKCKPPVNTELKKDTTQKLDEPPPQEVEEAENRKDIPNFEQSLWEIEIHEDVMHFLKNKTEAFICKQAMETLHKLASGDWNIKNHKPLNTKTKRPNLRIFETKLTKAPRIIYQLSVRFSQCETEKINHIKFETSRPIHIYSQVLVVWDVILNHDRVQHCVDRIAKLTGNMEEQPHLKPIFVDRNETGPTVPQLYLNTKDLKENELVQIERWLSSKPENCDSICEEDIGAKVYSLSNQLVLGVLHGDHKRRDYPIKVTDEEHDIITIPESEPVLVLGRSGTGKTTTCLCRLWIKFKDYWNSSDIMNPSIPRRIHNASDFDLHSSENTGSADDSSKLACAQSGENLNPNEDTCTISEYEHLHQVFITKNYTLCAKMKERFYAFVAGNDELTKEHLSNDKLQPQQKLSEIDDRCFPLFLTAREFFMKVDKSIGDRQEYFKAGDNVASTDYGQENKHTLHQLLNDSESDLSDSEDKPDDEERKVKKRCKKEEVTAATFRSKIWREISKFCADSKTDPLLIWMEIQSFIKGSRESLNCAEGFISEKEYLKIGKKQAPNFPLKREEVYKLFKEYQKLFRHKNFKKDQFDNCDFIKNLHTRLSRKANDIPWSIHRMYVDEVQDFTQAELSLLMLCCKDPNGFFFAGDTAQTIIKGISFRFEDLKSLFYHQMKTKIGARVPRLQMLTVNHRSHCAITHLSTSITDLLKRFFEHSFDWRNIPDDQSNIKGPKPLFISSKSTLQNFLLLQNGDEQSHSSVEFGADQVVIVRDEKSMANLPEYLKNGIVLTIQECKGLEFNDVLLYNFFKDGTCTEQFKDDIWRLSATFLEEEKDLIKQAPYCTTIHPLEFNEIYHKTFAAELKFLYTVVTRAKHHVWLYDDMEPQAPPMFDYWYRRGLIEVVTPQNNNTHHWIGSTNVKSTLEDWKRRGDTYWEQQLWQQARICYQKAKEDHLEKLAYASSLTVQKASKLKTERHMISSFSVAATVYIDCDKSYHNTSHLHEAAVCLFHAKLYHESAELFEKLQDYDLAKMIYGRKYLKDWESSVRVREKCGEYRDAVKVYLNQRYVNKALLLASEYITKGRMNLQNKPFLRLTESAYRQIKTCLHKKDFTNFAEYIVIIPNMSEQVYFLKRAKLYHEACEVLLKHKMYDDTYRICSAQGIYEDGIKLAKEMEDDRMKSEFVLQRATKHLYDGKDLDPDDQQQLEELKELKDYKLKARASLLLSMGLIHGYDSIGLDQAQKLCTCAWEIYKLELKNKVGEVEAFHILQRIREKKGIHTFEIVEDTIHTIAVAEGVYKVLTEPATALARALHDIEEFYGLQRQGGAVYSMLKGQDLYVNLATTCSCKERPTDSDGMLQLDRRRTLVHIQRHLKIYIRELNKSLHVAGPLWQRRIENSFPFHNELLEAKRLKKLPSSPINQYLHLYEVALKVHKLKNKVFLSEDISAPLCRLLSPFCQLSLQFKRENYALISRSEISWSTLFKQRVDANLKTVTDTSKPPDVNCWLEAWRLLSIKGSSDVSMINNAISEQKENVNREFHLQRSYGWEYGYNPAKDSPYTYVYIKREKCYEHYFTMWISSCNIIREKNKVLIAIKMSFSYFIQVIARRRTLRMISTENLVNILSIYSTALLAMISVVDKTRPFVIPESFYLLTQTFDMLNCQEETHTTLLEACLQTSQAVNHQRLKNDCVQLINDILNLLLGYYNKYFNPLKFAIGNSKQILSSEALHCLVLTLTLLGNLASSHFIRVEEAQRLLHTILYTLGNGVTGQGDVEAAQVLKEAFLKSETCTNVKDVFAIIGQLLTTVDLEIMELKTVTSLGKSKIRVKTSSPSQVLPGDYRWAPYEIHPLVKKQVTESVKQTPLLIQQNMKDHKDDRERADTDEEHTEDTDEGQSDDEASEDILESGEDDQVDEEETDVDDEDVLKEVSAAVQVKYQKQKSVVIDTDLEREINSFLTKNHCTICDVPIEGDRAKMREHFKSTSHERKRSDHDTFCHTLSQYETMHDHLQNYISDMREKHANYKVEGHLIKAEEHLREHNESVCQIQKTCDWIKGVDELKEICEKLKLLTGKLEDDVQQTTIEAEDNNQNKEEENDELEWNTVTRKGKRNKRRDNPKRK